MTIARIGIVVVLLALAALALFARRPESAAPVRPASACSHVVILDPLPMPGLERRRAIRLHLPPDYAVSDRRYPVLYLHDGQNLFDDATSYAGEWRVDETLDRLHREGLDVIAVGIDNGGEKRMNELGPWTNVRFGASEGEAYLRFVVDTVKPFIDAHYRTLPDRRHTAILGSSMGGLMSHYALFARPDVFGGAGVLSPSYWFAADVFTFGMDRPPPTDARIWLSIGDREGSGFGDDPVRDVLRMQSTLIGLGERAPHWTCRVVAGAEHNEAAWREMFPDAVRYLFDEPITTSRRCP